MIKKRCKECKEPYDDFSVTGGQDIDCMPVAACTKGCGMVDPYTEHNLEEYEEEQ